MQSGESRGAEHTFLAWTGDPGDGAAPATKRLTLLTSRGLHRLPTLCVFFMTRATQRPNLCMTYIRKHLDYSADSEYQSCAVKGKLPTCCAGSEARSAAQS